MSSVMLEKVLACPGLPVLPPVAVELMELIRNPDVEPVAVDALLERDPALTGKILDAVNSEHFASREPCTTVARAVSAFCVATEAG